MTSVGRVATCWIGKTCWWYHAPDWKSYSWYYAHHAATRAWVTLSTGPRLLTSQDSIFVAYVVASVGVVGARNRPLKGLLSVVWRLGAVGNARCRIWIEHVDTECDVKEDQAVVTQKCQP